MGSSSGSGILGTEKNALNNSVAEKEEAVEIDVSERTLDKVTVGDLQSDEVEGVNGLLAGAVALTRLAEAALSAAPVLRREDEGSKPEVGEDKVERRQVSAVSANERQYGTNEPETQSNSGLDAKERGNC